MPEQQRGVWLDPAIVERAMVADQYSLNQSLLDRHSAVVLTMHNDQRHLAAHQSMLENYVRDGGTLVVQGQIAMPFLSFLKPYIPLCRPRMDQLIVRRRQAHPVFDGFNPESLNIRKGVRGFYGRGHNPPPPDADVLQTIADDIPLDWFLTWGKGRVLMHSGNDIWGTYADATENRRFALQLINWCLNR
ncbi:MAG: hypothetical protein GC183_14330 [Thiobacillus sp.]|nr:hypothetical protein [Thiobacillus sp.]